MEKTNVEKHISLLGKTAKDRITGVEGPVTSICFDLYGCVQAAINTGLNKDGDPKEGRWLDVSRLEITSDERVMQIPNFAEGIVAEGKKGPEFKAPPRA